jgi:hypothetical protein
MAKERVGRIMVTATSDAVEYEFKRRCKDIIPVRHLPGLCYGILSVNRSFTDENEWLAALSLLAQWVREEQAPVLILIEPTNFIRIARYISQNTSAKIVLAVETTGIGDSYETYKIHCWKNNEYSVAEEAWNIPEDKIWWRIIRVTRAMKK